MSNNAKMMAAVMALPPADLITDTKLDEPIGAGAYYRADTVVRMLAAERERCAKLCDAKSESTDCSDESLQTWIDAAELIRKA